MQNQQVTREKLTMSNLNVKRDIQKSRKEPLPVSDLSGKGILDGSNNRSKMNYQNN